MKRTVAILSLILLLASCSTSSNPVLKDYRLRQTGGMNFGPDGVSTTLKLDVRVENPSSARYVLESLEGVLYKGFETSSFAEFVMPEAVTLEPRCDTTLSIVVDASCSRPLALLSGGFSTDLADYTADVDLTVRKGSLKKRIKKQRIALDQLEEVIGQKNEKKEKK